MKGDIAYCDNKLRYLLLTMKGGFLLKRKKITALISAAAVTASVVPVSLTAVFAEEPTTLEVGAGKKYTTISEAVAEAKAIDPQSEEARVTINIDPGDYEEQVRIEGLSYITLQQTPGTEDDGRVDLYWYYCTGYCAGNAGLDGRYDPKINWSDPRTWTGYDADDEHFTEYRLGQQLTGVETISYYDTDGVAHEDVKVGVTHLGNFDQQAALYIDNKSTDITVKDLNIVNAVPVMVTEGEKEVGLAPQEDRNSDHATSYILPKRDNLAVCDEDTVPEGTERVVEALAIENDVEKTKAIESLEDLTPGESAYLVRSDKYNERGHAIAINGDKITFEGVRARGNQDSVWVGEGRQYFKDCDLIGGTDYIYGDATVVFDNCLLGAAGFTNNPYGATITAANHDGANPYGYLFYNCTLYNVLDNIGDSMLGRPWRQDAQITFYNLKIDDTAEVGASKAGLTSDAWRDMSGSEADKARFYEYGTYNASGAPVDLSGRVKNENGFGTVLDEWQILEFNPRNYFNSDFWLETKGKDEWDPMGFGDTIADVDNEIDAVDLSVPAGNDTVINLPEPQSENVEFRWESASSNAVVSPDGKNIEVIRPAAGEAPIETAVILYARDTETGLGDKREIPVTINATTDTENVFNIPVTIEQSTTADNNYTVTVTKNGALIKSQVIAVEDGKADTVIENIPASEEGISYDVSIVSESDDFTVIVPDGGKTTVTGKTGADVSLAITAQKLVDETVDTGISFTPESNAYASFDLIALAKEKGAGDDLMTSDVITVEYDFITSQRPSQEGFIDLRSTEPSQNYSTDADPDRFVLTRIKNNWDQLDMVDNSQGISGSSTIEGVQWLNIAGKFDYDNQIPSHVKITINYKTQTITVNAQGSGSSQGTDTFTFAHFPAAAEKGKLYMAVYPKGEDVYNITNVEVTYKRVVTGDEPEPEIPEGEGVYEFPGTNEAVIGGNLCVNESAFMFTDDADPEIAAFFADETDKTAVKNSLTANYKNYIGGTGTDTHPSITLNAPAGKYRIYYLGYNSGNNITAEVNGNVYTAGAGENCAYSADNPSYVLKVYTIDIEMTEANSVITFDSADQWLPDLYALVAVGSGELEPGTDPDPGPDVKQVYEFAGNDTDVTGGRTQQKDTTFKFSDGVDPETAALFADEEDSTAVKSSLTSSFKNYIGGTGSNAAHPSITLNAPAGEYRIYYLGYNHGNNITAEVNGNVYTASAGVNFAYDVNSPINILKLYTIDIEMTEPDSVITFDSADEWLPDLYALIVEGSGEPVQQPTPTPTAAATPTPTAAATATPTAAATATPTAAPAVSPTPTTAVQTSAPTEETDTEPKIVSAYKEDGNTVVKLNNIDDGVVIGAVYDDNGALVSMKTAEVNGDDIILEGIEADKVFVWNSMQGMKPVCGAASVSDVPPESTPEATATAEPTPEAPVQPTQLPDGTIKIDFSVAGSVPVYSEASGQGFTSLSGAYAAEGYEREVAPADEIKIADGAAVVTEDDGDYLRAEDDYFPNSTDGGNHNYGGLIYRFDTEGAGAYHIEVEVTDSSSVYVAPTGMDASRLTGTSNWDNAGEVPRKVSAKWSGNVWSYDFATGEDFVEIEIEPRTLPTEDAPQTVGVRSISIKPLEVNPAGDKPTIHIIGDSTQKTYTFNETISGWGQMLGKYFDSDKVNVVNYSMGGRAMKSNYTEGRFDEVLISGKQGDYVFIHSAHNDETTSLNRFSRGAGLYSGNLEANNANYQRWLDMYVEAIKARGMMPVLVTAMPRTKNGVYSESEDKPNGFNPDSPALMRAKAASDPQVGLVELYDGATSYIDSLDSEEVKYIYNSYEAGETPAENSANGTGGDGTHYREAAAKQWTRIMLQSIYDQANAETDTYTDKAIMQELVALMPDEVTAAAQSGDWSAVFPEMASDVSAVGVVPGAQKQSEENYYYRNNIEKALELGLLHKNGENLFMPNAIVTVGEFARGAEKAFGLAENTLTNYTRTYDELQSGETAEASVELMEANDVSAQSDDGSEAAEGQVTITVEQPEGGTVTVYNESAFDSITVDMPNEPQPNEVISDNEYFTLTAPATIESKGDSSAAFAEAPEIDNAGIVTRNSDDKETYITAKADGKLIAYVRGRADRAFALKDMSTGTAVEYGVNNAPLVDGDGSNVFGTVTFDITAGATYQLYARSFGGILFGVRYESSDYPQSTESLAVNSGDTVRVVAVANENYEYDSILVNGEPVDASREYIFEALTDTTVSASFTAEPALVATAPVASDAALTREVMAAILYDAYTAITDETVKANIEAYMAQTGSVLSPDDPNYDPNLTYEGETYAPLTGWGALTDTDSIEDALYQKVKAAYNWGLIRSDAGITRGMTANGTALEPKTEVTRAKAAKSLVFAFLLTQPQGSANQKLPDGMNHAGETAEIALPNESAPSVPVL